jgi:hypothetical protein
MPFGLGKCVILWYIEMALGFIGVDDRGRELCIKEKGLKDWSESSKGIYCYGD